jgi:thiamine biosynthesis lipoprotein
MTSDHHSVVCRRGAMNTLFEMMLVGDDEENLHAAGEAALDEIERIEKLLSRFDPTSETSRINRDAHPGPVIVDHEVVEILRRCHEYSFRTDGYFDVTAVSRAGHTRGEPQIAIDPDRRLLRFQRSGVFLDFGGCGKGYAIDRAVTVLRESGIQKALLHGGTSSVRAIGNWPVGVRDPWDAAVTAAAQVHLSGESLSCSATSHGSEASDIVNPSEGRCLTGQAACLVIANGDWSAFEVEMFSTGLLAMGRQRARVCCRREENRGTHVAWIDRRDDRTTMEWLSVPHG